MPMIKCIVDFIYVECPYCKHRNLIAPDSEYNEFIHYCTVEDGGCDEPFVVQYRAKTEFETKVGKIFYG